LLRLLRAQLPPQEAEEQFISALCDNVTSQEAPAVQLCLVGGRKTPTGEDGKVVPLLDRPPRRRLVLAFARALERRGVRVLESLWASHTRYQGTWQEYVNPDRRGTVPNPDHTLLAVATVANGGVTYASREDLAKSLECADEKALARRNKSLDFLNENPHVFPIQTPAARIRALRAEVKNIDDGSFRVTDELVVRLAYLLCDYRVRDVALAMSMRGASVAYEQLWLELTKGTPAPERAEPACLLAFSAYRRGDGVLANLAVDIALKAQPSHTLANLLARAIAVGLPPGDVVAAVNRSYNGAPDFLVPQVQPQRD
ncbi:DUF4192 domain-containing protein, partial [Crossiella equi]|uniref:DUF4192 domain-containing protein n=1 Tax=Crossiella equi TaxID=130796 RepID=UPI000A3712D5